MPVCPQTPVQIDPHDRADLSLAIPRALARPETNLTRRFSQAGKTSWQQDDKTGQHQTQPDLAQVANRANCGKPTACSPAELTGNASGGRPWGANNPVWRLYAYGRLPDFAPGAVVDSIFYVVVLVADDPSETDDDPTRDGVDSAVNPGTGVLALRSEAFGPRGVHGVVELTAARPDGSAQVLRVLSWRQVR